MKNTLDGINRLASTEEWISDLKDRLVEINHQNSEKKKDRYFKRPMTSSVIETFTLWGSQKVKKERNRNFTRNDD